MRTPAVRQKYPGPRNDVLGRAMDRKFLLFDAGEGNYDV